MGAHGKTFDDNPLLPAEKARGAQNLMGLIGLVGLGLSAAAYFGVIGEGLQKQFFFSWLAAFAFFLTICLGGLFFTILHHLVRAGWSTGLRRIAENVAANIPLMAIFFLPLLVGVFDLYHWAHYEHELHGEAAASVARDPFLDAKAGYLNLKAFLIRAGIFFLIWIATVTFFRKISVAQDADGDEAKSFSMRRAAPISMLLFALSLTFASFDWLMSLDPHWFSTMFGVYIFAGSVIAIFATLILVTIWLTGRGVLNNTLTVGNFHDAGKLLFGFIIFWTYISFSQYYLIWYANIPEETAWYLHRMHGGWENIATLIIFGHFIVPFWLLISRFMKRNRRVLGTLATWMLFMHFVDLYYVISPTLHDHVSLHWLDLTTFLGIGGTFLWLFIGRCQKDAVVAHKDPMINISMRYDNV